MGLNLGSLTVALDADAKQMEAGIGQAKRALRNMRTALNKTDRKAVATGRAISKSFKKAGKQIEITRQQVKRFSFVLAAAATAAIVAGTNFSKGLGELEAITGIAGSELDMFEQAAKRLSTTTQQSATEILSAFKLIGSAKSELVGTPALLIETAEAAITLAEAAGIDLTDASAALGNTLNQFGLSGADANRVINVLAAGAALGAKEIPFLTQAMKEAAPVAKLLGISVEETVAILEGLGRSGIEASKAGTGFRNFFTILSTSGIADFNVEVLGAQKVIENLKAANLDIAESEKLFGREVLVASAAILEQSGFIADLLPKITGTAEAQRQAAVNADTLSGKFVRLKNSASTAGIAFTQQVEPILNFFLFVGTAVTDAIGNIDGIYETLVSQMIKGTIHIGAAFQGLGLIIKTSLFEAFDFGKGVVGSFVSVLASAFDKIPGLGNVSKDLFDFTGDLARDKKGFGSQSFNTEFDAIKSDQAAKIKAVDDIFLQIFQDKLPGLKETSAATTAKEEVKTGFQGRPGEIDESTLPQLGGFTANTGPSEKILTQERILQEMILMRQAFERGENTLELKVEVDENNIVKLITKNPAFQAAFDKRTEDATRQAIR